MVRTLFGFIPCHLTSSPPSSGYIFVWLCPGVVVALLKYIYPEYNVGIARQLIFAMQAVCTCVFGYHRLHRFDGELKDTYADMECRDTTAVKHLLVAFCRHVGSVVVCQCRRQAGRLLQRAVLLSQFPQVCRHGARRVGCQDATLTFLLRVFVRGAGGACRFLFFSSLSARLICPVPYASRRS